MSVSKMRGTLHLDDVRSFAGLNIDLVVEEVPPGDQGVSKWWGTFEWNLAVILMPGGPCDLLLHDGRSGQILITRINISGESSSAESQGNGALA